MRDRSASVRLTLAWTGLFLVCFQGVLAVALERGPVLRDPEYATRLSTLRRRLADRPDSRPLLLLGSSRVVVGFRPEELPRYHTPDGREVFAFNAGLIGAGPLTELLCLRRLLADGVRPEAVLAEYWPSTELAEDVRIPPQRLGWRDVNLLGPLAADPAHFYRDWAEYRLLPWFTYRQAVVRTVAPGWLPPQDGRDARIYDVDGGGWRPSPQSVVPAVRRRVVAQQCDLHTRVFQSFHPTPTAERALRDLLALCRQEGIPAALMFLPESTRFRGCYPPALVAEIDRWMDGLAREYGVPRVNARTWVADEQFADAYHLLPNGAAAFTARLGREALEPLVAGRLPPAGEPTPP